jgi:hypothetical protein
MKIVTAYFSLLIIFFSIGCDQREKEQPVLLEVQRDQEKISSMPFVRMSRDSLYNKVLGAFVGSAIGDAMGAPTEMWSRANINLEYGFVDSLDRMVREPSPEGTWDYNLPAGGTTDDTRWKVFMARYILNNPETFYTEKGPDPFDFAQSVVDQYTEELERIKNVSGFEPDQYENQMRRIAWLQEFALVAKEYADQNLNQYRIAVNKFYGGDMACPGLLYAPSIGILYPRAPDMAYKAAYKLSIFDIGYAMDITALTTSMVSVAMTYQATPQKMLDVLSDIDPQQYFKSRLLGRITYRIYRESLFIAREAKKEMNPAADPDFYPDILDRQYAAQLQKAYEMLDERNQDVPFHAGEIHLINLTALIFTDFDFRRSMEFITNYGRDNDTVAAITGTILGAFYGYSRLPQDMRESVLKTNKEKLGIDLENIADQITDMMMQNNAVAVK